MALNVTVQIISASNLNGVFPFVVVCFDNDLENEVYKTSATFGGSLAVWNESFPLDLTTHMKKIVDSGKPEPTYLTFFMFDTGVEGIPTLGSAGVLLSTVNEKGIAKGDFPVINGSGTLSLVVEVDQQKWFKTNTAKYAAGAVGVGAVAAGLTALAINNKKKKKGNSTRQVVVDDDDRKDEKKKKKFSLSESVRAIADRVGVTGDRDEDDDDDDDESDDSGNEKHHRESRKGRANAGGDASNSRARSVGNTTGAVPTTGAAPSASGGRKWWDPETDEDEHDDDDDDDDVVNTDNIGRHNDRFDDDIHDDDKLDDEDDHHEFNARHNLRYVQPAPSRDQDYDQPANLPNRYDGAVRNEAHHYQGEFAARAGIRGTSNESGVRGRPNEGADFQNQIRTSDQLGEFGGTTYIQDDYQNADLAARLDA